MKFTQLLADVDLSIYLFLYPSLGIAYDFFFLSSNEFHLPSLLLRIGWQKC